MEDDISVTPTGTPKLDSSDDVIMKSKDASITSKMVMESQSNAENVEEISRDIHNRKINHDLDDEDRDGIEKNGRQNEKDTNAEAHADQSDTLTSTTNASTFLPQTTTLPTNSHTLTPLPFTVASRLWPKNPFLSNAINTNGALPLPFRLRRRKTMLLNERLVNDMRDLKSFGLPLADKYSVALPSKIIAQRKLRPHVKNDADVYIRSVGLRKPKAQLYSQSLVLGEWMDEHADEEKRAEDGFFKNHYDQGHKGGQNFDSSMEGDVSESIRHKSMARNTKLDKRVMLVVRKGAKKIVPSGRVLYRRRKIHPSAGPVESSLSAAAASRGPIQYSVVKQVGSPFSKTLGQRGKKLVKKTYFMPRQSLKQRLDRARGDRFGAGGHRIVRNGGNKRKIFGGRRKKVLHMRPSSREMVFLSRNGRRNNMLLSKDNFGKQFGLKDKEYTDDEYYDLYGSAGKSLSGTSSVEFKATSRERITTQHQQESGQYYTTNNPIIESVDYNDDNEKNKQSKKLEEGEISKKNIDWINSEDLDNMIEPYINSIGLKEGSVQKSKLEEEAVTDLENSFAKEFLGHTLESTTAKRNANIMGYVTYVKFSSYNDDGNTTDLFPINEIASTMKNENATRIHYDHEQTELVENKTVTPNGENIGITNSSLESHMEIGNKTSSSSVKNIITDEYTTNKIEEERTVLPTIDTGIETIPTTEKSEVTSLFTLKLNLTAMTDNKRNDRKMASDMNMKSTSGELSSTASKSYKDKITDLPKVNGSDDFTNRMDDISVTVSLNERKSIKSLNEEILKMDSIEKIIEENNHEKNQAPIYNKETGNIDISLRHVKSSNVSIQEAMNNSLIKLNGNNITEKARNDILESSTEETKMYEMDLTNKMANVPTNYTALHSNDLHQNSTNFLFKSKNTISNSTADNKNITAYSMKTESVIEPGDPFTVNEQHLKAEHSGDNNTIFTQNITTLQKMSTMGIQKKVPIDVNDNDFGQNYRKGILDKVNVDQTLNAYKNIMVVGEQDYIGTKSDNENVKSEKKLIEKQTGGIVILENTTRALGEMENQLSALNEASVGKGPGIETDQISRELDDLSTTTHDITPTSFLSSTSSSFESPVSTSTTKVSRPKTSHKNLNIQITKRVFVKPVVIPTTKVSVNHGIIKEADYNQFGKTSLPVIYGNLTTKIRKEVTLADKGKQNNTVQNLITESNNDQTSDNTNDSKDIMPKVKIVSKDINGGGLERVNQISANLIHEESKNITSLSTNSSKAVQDSNKYNPTDEHPNISILHNQPETASISSIEKSEDNSFKKTYTSPIALTFSSNKLLSSSSSPLTSLSTTLSSSIINKSTMTQETPSPSSSSSSSLRQTSLSSVSTPPPVSSRRELPSPTLKIASSSSSNQPKPSIFSTATEISDLKRVEQQDNNNYHEFVKQSTQSYDVEDDDATTLTKKSTESKSEFFKSSPTFGMSKDTNNFDQRNQQEPFTWSGANLGNNFESTLRHLGAFHLLAKPKATPFRARFSKWIEPNGQVQFEPKSDKIDLWKAYNIALTDGDRRSKKAKQSLIEKSPVSIASQNYLWGVRTGMNSLGGDFFNSVPKRVEEMNEIKGRQMIELRKASGEEYFDPFATKNNVGEYDMQNQNEMRKIDEFNYQSAGSDIKQKAAHVHDWGHRFSQGFYGRVYDDRRQENDFKSQQPKSVSEYKTNIYRNGGNDKFENKEKHAAKVESFGKELSTPSLHSHKATSTQVKADKQRNAWNSQDITEIQKPKLNAHSSLLSNTLLDKGTQFNSGPIGVPAPDGKKSLNK